jgi:hypothetical protein
MKCSSSPTEQAHTCDGFAATLVSGGRTTRGTPGGTDFWRPSGAEVSQDSRAEGARDELDRELGGLVLAVENRVDLDHLERPGEAGLGY